MTPEIASILEITIVLTVAVLLPLLTYLWGYNRGAYKIEQGSYYEGLNTVEKILFKHLRREIQWLRRNLKQLAAEPRHLHINTRLNVTDDETGNTTTHETQQDTEIKTESRSATQEPLSLAAATELLMGCSSETAEKLTDLNGWNLYVAYASPAEIPPAGCESPWVAVVIQRDRVTEVAAVG